MKTIHQPHMLHRRHGLTTLALKIGLFAGLSALPLQAQADENIPAGYTEDEWFDPGDWFDGDNIEPARTDWWDNDGWSNSADYDNNYDSMAFDNDGWSDADDFRNDANNSQDDWTTETDKQSARNQPQNQNDKQSARNQPQNQSDKQSTRNHQRNQSDDQSTRDQRKNRSDQQSGRYQQRNQDKQQTSRNQRNNLSDRNQESYGNQDRSMKVVSFDGKVDGFKKVNLKDREGKSDEFTFVRVTLNDDEVRVVSLGSRLILSDLDLEKGDQINVSGRTARIDNREVLVANRIEVGDTVFRVRKDNRPNIGQNVSIKGTVKDSSETSLSNNSREKNVLVRLELENGTSCVVDLGRGMTLSDLDIEEGSEIQLQGEKTKVNGKSLIIARKISVDGDSTRVRGKSRDSESESKESWTYSGRESRVNSQNSASSD